ncbi:hemerythrin domain-containing protein [Clostridium sp. YIM B02551]|uniref:hemerythrin domain-containing protein n=1 Tax=Clostridium sp. YIM B02551 TaxID=2910679 RepID=UPI001EEA829E|nr:hemerythrin domain-containing protein [Clostridium sp. YIM B02551]
MDAISLMVDEHKYIKRMLVVVRKVCVRILQGEDISYDDFSKIIDFVRNYADNHHHGKEEKILFNRMVSEIGGVADKLVNQGMLVEHDLGRLHMRELELALDRVKAGDEESKLDVIANAISYTHLLTRHIEKEDNTVYTFAQRKLSKESLEQINKECEDFENKAIEDEVSKLYIDILKSLEAKYL